MLNIPIEKKKHIGKKYSIDTEEEKIIRTASNHGENAKEKLRILRTKNVDLIRIQIGIYIFPRKCKLRNVNYKLWVLDDESISSR